MACNTVSLISAAKVVVRLLTDEVLFLMICSRDNSFGALDRREGLASSTWYMSLATSVSDNIVKIHLLIYDGSRRPNIKLKKENCRMQTHDRVVV